jgi:hypothetical protein
MLRVPAWSRSPAIQGKLTPYLFGQVACSMMFLFTGVAWSYWYFDQILTFRQALIQNFRFLSSPLVSAG